jgi:hypothetical protein
MVTKEKKRKRSQDREEEEVMDEGEHGNHWKASVYRSSAYFKSGRNESSVMKSLAKKRSRKIQKTTTNMDSEPKESSAERILRLMGFSLVLGSWPVCTACEKGMSIMEVVGHLKNEHKAAIKLFPSEIPQGDAKMREMVKALGLPSEPPVIPSELAFPIPGLAIGAGERCEGCKSI